MFSTQSLDRLLTLLGIFCRDEISRENLPQDPKNNPRQDRDYLVRHGVSMALVGRSSGRSRFDELANRIRDYPGPLPAIIQGSKLESFEKIQALLKEIEIGTERPEPEIWGKLESLRKHIQEGQPIQAPRDSVFQVTSNGWECPRGVVRIQDWLRNALAAYLDGSPKIILDTFGRPSDVAHGLKKMIREARELGFDPPENRWPSARKDGLKDRTIFFDAFENQNQRNKRSREKA